jgi:hypothetical protein
MLGHNERSIDGLVEVENCEKEGSPVLRTIHENLMQFNRSGRGTLEEKVTIE